MEYIVLIFESFCFFSLATRKDSCGSGGRLKRSNGNGISPVQNRTDKINMTINFGIAVGTGGLGSYVQGVKAGVAVGAAQFAVMESMDISNLISPESVSIPYMNLKF